MKAPLNPRIHATSGFKLVLAQVSSWFSPTKIGFKPPGRAPHVNETGMVPTLTVHAVAIRVGRCFDPVLDHKTRTPPAVAARSSLLKHLESTFRTKVNQSEL